MRTIKYSVIIPVYNRPDEVQELLDSLEKQEYQDFEIIIIEDGSNQPCDNIVNSFSGKLDIKYFFKENTGPGDTRNYGMDKANGEYFIFFDSDCIIPPDYFVNVEKQLKNNELGVFGGPDHAHSSFTKKQKAINYSMTSFFTTGGIRGKKGNLDTYQPRSFNMGIRKDVYAAVGGFGTIHPGEDPDLSYRIMDAGFKSRLIEDAIVFHKRRIDFSKFIKQVYKFGVVRTILMKWYPEKFNFVYLFPFLFLLSSLGLIVIAALFQFYWALLPFALLTVLLFTDSLVKTKSLAIALLAVPASFIQLFGYGYGFMLGIIKLHLLRMHEKKAFKNFFFDMKKG